jgi:hypothetical protein
MKLRADVVRRAGKTKHSVGFIEDGEPVPSTLMPLAHCVEIVEDEDGIYLYRYDMNGECVGDTWHMTLDEAKEQAEFEFSIGINDWREEPSS